MTPHRNYFFPFLIQNLALPGRRKDQWKTSVWWVDTGGDGERKEIWCLLFTMDAELGKKKCSPSRKVKCRQLPRWGNLKAGQQMEAWGAGAPRAPRPSLAATGKHWSRPTVCSDTVYRMFITFPSFPEGMEKGSLSASPWRPSVREAGGNVTVGGQLHCLNGRKFM